MSGLRERNKEKRRQAILAASLDLLRSNEIGSVTIEQIAARAEVSPPTVYNLVGTRDQLLVALIDRVIEQLLEDFSRATDDADRDPIEIAKEAVDRASEGFVADSHAYRQVVRSLGDLAVSGSHMAIDVSQFHVRTMRRAQERGIIRPDLDPIALGRQIYLAYVAALVLWAGEGLSDRGFGLAALHGLLTVVSAASTDEFRDGFVTELAELGRQFARASWNPR